MNLKRGASIIITMAIIVGFLLAAISLFKLISSESIANLTQRKSYQANQSSVASVEKAISNLSNRFKILWLNQIYDPGEGLYVVKKSSTTGTVDVNDADLITYLTDGKYSSFLVDCLNDCGAPETICNVLSTGVTDYLNAWYYMSETDKDGKLLSDSKITLTVNTSKSKFTAGFGVNRCLFAFSYDIVSTGYGYIGKSTFTQTVHIKSKKDKDIEINIHRESYAKYALFSRTMQRDNTGLNPVVFDSMKINGPVFAGGDLYIRNSPKFTDKVIKLQAVRILDYVDPIINSIELVYSGEPITYNMLYKVSRTDACFTKTIENVAATPFDASVTQAAQAAFALDGQPAGTLYHRNSSKKTVYIDTGADNVLIEISKSGTRTKYEFYRCDLSGNKLFGTSFSNFIQSTSQDYLIYCVTDIFVKGEIKKDCKVTIATPENIYIVDTLQYDTAAMSSSSTSGTVIGLISWDHNIQFRPSPPFNASTEYKIHAVLYVEDGEFGVWCDQPIVAPDIVNTYPLAGYSGKITHYGSIICNYLNRTQQLDVTSIYHGFTFKSSYDPDLAYKKAPPMFPGNGRYFLPSTNLPTVLDVYYTVRN